MPCEHVRMPGGITAIVCTGKARQKKCSVCGAPGTRLCDWEFERPRDFGERSATCDKPLCIRCSIRNGETDHCPDHARGLQPRQGVLAL